LLEGGVDINAQDSQGWTALMMAAAHGHTEIVRMMLERGADREIKEEKGLTALMMAQQYNYSEYRTIVKNLTKIFH